MRINLDVPNGWDVKSLGEVATLQRGFDLPVQDRCEGDVPIFAANGPVGTHKVVKVDGPGVVTGRSGTIGKVHFVESGYWPLNTSLWVKDFHGNDPRWVARLLKWIHLERHTRGTGVPTLNRNLVHVVPVPVPPLAEQKRIAAILDKADAIRRKRQETIALTEKFLRSAFLDMFGDPVTNPKGWGVAQLNSLVRMGDKINYGVVQPGSDFENGKPLIRVGDLVSGKIVLANMKMINPEIEAKHARSRLIGDEVLVGCVGSIGAIALAQPEHCGFNIARAVSRVPLDGMKVHRDYVASYLRTDFVQQFFRSEIRVVAQPTLNVRQLKETPILVPPIEKQIEFSTLVPAINKIAANQSRSTEMIENLFNSLVQRAFRGDLQSESLTSGANCNGQEGKARPH